MKNNKSGFTLKRSANAGFTLIELLLVVTILSLLAVTVFVALNPSQRLLDTKNARRSQDVDTILNAIHQSIVDNRGTLPTNLVGIGTTTKQLGTAVTGCDIATGSAGCYVPQDQDCANLMVGSQNLASYLKSMPVDPDETPYTAALTGYSVQVDSTGIVTVRSCGAEGTTISASR